MKIYHFPSDQIDALVELEVSNIVFFKKDENGKTKDCYDREYYECVMTLTHPETKAQEEFAWTAFENPYECRAHLVLWSLLKDRLWAGGSFETFCKELGGYNVDSRRDHAIFLTMVENNRKLEQLFSKEEIDNMWDTLFDQGI